MSDRAFISVIIPAHNEAKEIVHTLEAIKKSSFVKEIIVVCDSCSDNTEELALQQQVSTLSVTSGSAAESRNFGAAQARGEFLLFLDADTITSSNLYALLHNHKETLDYGTAPFQSDSGKLIGRYIANSMNRFNKKHRTMGGNCFVRRELFQHVNGFDATLLKGEDTDLGERLLAAGGRYGFLEESYILHNERKFREHGYIRYFTRLYFESVYYLLDKKGYHNRFSKTATIQPL